jgi:hypothetical protein
LGDQIKMGGEMEGHVARMGWWEACIQNCSRKTWRKET